VTAQARETDRSLLPTKLDEDAAAVQRSLEIDRVVGFDPEQIADGLRDCDLSFACNRRCHLMPVIRTMVDYYEQGAKPIPHVIALATRPLALA
jgi:hypothetical protein